MCSLQFSSSCRLNDWDRCHDRLADAEEYRYNRRGDATALVTKWQLGEQYIFVSTSFVFVHGWRSGLQAKTLVRIAQRVGSIQMGFCCIYYFSFYLLFFRVLTFLSYVFGNVYENGFCLISSNCFQPWGLICLSGILAFASSTTIEDRYELTGLCCSCVIVCCFARSSFNSFLLIQRFKKSHFSECITWLFTRFI